LRTIFALAAVPLICLLGFAILLIMSVYLVVRSIRSRSTSISSISLEAKKTDVDNTGHDSDRTHADLPFSPTQISAKSKGKSCPACGAENPNGASQCEYCGSKLVG
jgi:hypothetical protein